jgi:hypothetical protein
LLKLLKARREATDLIEAWQGGRLHGAKALSLGVVHRLGRRRWRRYLLRLPSLLLLLINELLWLILFLDFV